MNYVSNSAEVNIAFVTQRMLDLEHRYVWCCSMDIKESRSEVPWKF